MQLGQNPGEILVLGSGHNLRFNQQTGDVFIANRPTGVEAAPNQTLGLVGGDVTFDGGNLTGDGGRIEIGSVGPGELVTLTPRADGFELGYLGVGNFRDIELKNAASVGGVEEPPKQIQFVGQNIFLQDGSVIAAQTIDAQSAGNIALQARNSVEIIGTSGDSLIPSAIFANVVPNATAKGGNVTIVTPTLRLADGGQIVIATEGDGQGGSLIVRSRDLVEMVGTSPEGEATGILAGTGVLKAEATGNGGDVTISTAKLRLVDGAQISVATGSAGNAGSLTVQATDSVEIIGTSPTGRLTGMFAGVVEEGLQATGNGGDMAIATSRLRLVDGGQIIVATGGAGNAGSLTVQAIDSVEIIGVSEVNGTQSLLLAGVNQNATGNGGNIRIFTSRLRIAQGGAISISTEGSGNGGELTVVASDSVEIGGNANDIGVKEELENSLGFDAIETAFPDFPSIESISDRPGIVAGTLAQGDGGDVTISTPRLRISDRAAIEVSTTGSGNGGNTRIFTSQLQVVDGSGILGGTLGSGNAGELTLVASDRIELSGDSLFGAGSVGTGNGGSVAIETKELIVSDGAQVRVGAVGTGNSGDIIAIATSDLLLNNQGAIAATSATGRGGNINLRSPRIQLRRGAEISATGSSTGNITLEGNININTETLILLEGSRIITDALNPGGGSNIAIGSLSDSSDGGNLAIFQSPDSIINAVGELNLETDLAVEPGLILEAKVADIEEVINRDLCSEEALQSSFIVTGKGGVPPNPTQPLNNSRAIVGWASAEEGRAAENSAENMARSLSSLETESQSNVNSSLVEATGWIVTAEGKILLVADAPGVTPTQGAIAHPDCRRPSAGNG